MWSWIHSLWMALALADLDKAIAATDSLWQQEDLQAERKHRVFMRKALIIFFAIQGFQIGIVVEAVLRLD